MHAHNDRDQFAPPRPPGRKRAIALAVLAHVVLIGALTWGVNWKTSADQPAVEAELWAAIPQQAAPRAAEPPPPPPAPAPAPAPVPQPAPPPPAPAPPPKAEPDPQQADIAIEREKKRLQEEKQRQQLEQDRRDKAEKAERERKEQEKQERLAQQKAQQEKAARDKAEKEKAERLKAEQEKQKKLAEEKRKAAAEAKRAEEFRQEQMRRIAGLAGAAGSASATGTALRSAGPSGSYGGKVAAAVKPNITFTDIVAGNPAAEVEVRAAPDGTITSRRLLKSSGNKAWDEAVLRALDKTERLPRDVDGRVPSQFPIVFRPKD